MPFTPFHLPAAAVAGWPLRHRIDLPTLLVVNLAVDVEPLVISVIGLGPPPHGPVHTLLGATAVGLATGWLVERASPALGKAFGQPYVLDLRTAALSGVIGAWLHVCLDAVMYEHLRPLAPWGGNPLHVPGSGDVLHLVCAVLLLPAAALLVRARWWRTVPQKLSLMLLGASAAAMAVSVAVGAAP